MKLKISMSWTVYVGCRLKTGRNPFRANQDQTPLRSANFVCIYAVNIYENDERYIYCKYKTLHCRSLSVTKLLIAIDKVCNVPWEWYR